MTKNQTGKNNPFYKGEKVKKLSDHNVVWKELREEHKVCQLCGKAKKLDIHHKDKNKTNNKKSNLMVVCRRCHLWEIHKQRHLQYLRTTICIICGKEFETRATALSCSKKCRAMIKANYQLRLRHQKKVVKAVEVALSETTSF